MDIKSTIIIVTIIIILKFGVLQAFEVIPLLMPNVRPTVNDEYLCTAFKMPEDDYVNIVAFQPNVTKLQAHHINIYACMPGKRKKSNPQYVWDCSHGKKYRGKYKPGKKCESKMKMIFTWSLDTPLFEYPSGVGYPVGKGTGVDYLVMEVHYAYADKFTNKTDDTGVFLTVLPSSDTSITKKAGFLGLVAGGQILPKQTVHMETACKIEDDVELHPFAFLPHTHDLGQVVAGYKIDKNGNWELIGKHYPLDPQQFYPTANENLTLTKGDVVAARCTQYNFRNRITNVGPANKDEMCDFYIMYYTDGDKSLNMDFCFKSGPPQYYWRWDPLIKKVPPEIDRDASTLNHPYLALSGSDLEET